jgi:hypothetical protein
MLAPYQYPKCVYVYMRDCSRNDSVVPVCLNLLTPSKKTIEIIIPIIESRRKEYVSTSLYSKSETLTILLITEEGFPLFRSFPESS